MNLVIQQSREWTYAKLIDKDNGKEIIRFSSEDCPGKAREHVFKALSYVGVKVGTEFLPDDDHGLKVGMEVKTVRRGKFMTDYTPDAIASRKFGITGRIIKEHDSHGLCYEVWHDDDTIGFYDPWELEIAP